MLSTTRERTWYVKIPLVTLQPDNLPISFTSCSARFQLCWTQWISERLSQLSLCLTRMWHSGSDSRVHLCICCLATTVTGETLCSLVSGKEEMKRFIVIIWIEFLFLSPSNTHTHTYAFKIWPDKSECSGGGFIVSFSGKRSQKDTDLFKIQQIND